MRISAALAGLGLVAAAGLPAGAAGIESAPVIAAAPASVQQQGQGRGQDRARQQGQGNQRDQAQPQQRGQGNQRQPAQAQQRGQGNQRQPAQTQQRGQGNQRQPAQAQQRGQGNQRQPAQAQQRGQGNQRQPAQAQQRGQGNQRQPAQAQQRGQGADRVQPQQGGRGQGAARGQAAPGRSELAPGQARRAGRPAPADLNRHVSALPADLRGWTRSSRPHERVLAGAAVYGTAFGLEPARLVWDRRGDYVLVANPRGDVLLHMNDRHARELGFWEVRRLGDYRPRGNAPAFCRSGAGHPVWGRQWCLDRGFGIGSRHGTIWSRAPVQDVIFRRGYYDRDRLARDVLISVIGDVVFNRLGVHALSMGMHDPLYGTWVAAPDPGAPRIMHVYSGDVVVAELVDTNRNDRADVIWILQPL